MAKCLRYHMGVYTLSSWALFQVFLKMYVSSRNEWIWVTDRKGSMSTISLTAAGFESVIWIN